MLVYLKPLQRYCIFLICANIFTTNRVLGGILIRCLAACSWLFNDNDDNIATEREMSSYSPKGLEKSYKSKLTHFVRTKYSAINYNR